MACKGCKNKCKECTPYNVDLGCIKDCGKFKCDFEFDSRCVFINCDTDYIKYDKEFGNAAVPGSQITIPTCISLFEFFNYINLFITDRDCIRENHTSRSVTDLYITKNGSSINISFTGVDASLLATGWSVVKYVIEIKDLSTNTIYTIDVFPNPTDQYNTSVGNPIIVVGHDYQIKVKTITSNGSSQSTCETINYIIKM